ncbi:glycosyltransferase [Xenorhabdus sp. XENO-10]|uniref:Glycosyltransferase n=1 Tax=Xenorhabdus yunnanensis TaxID=3025878 RepID=A0ABT5LDA6_9GAMM|nr:TcdA/TcdB catalytic glycosyltransferase domain-containing protein [Xenorhabdus yunnanensis]MDC9589092.1 glycosyltransferase [Xenorhabdus yunnanensis]
MHIPKKIHYFWAGSNIPEKDLRNIIEIKSKNPGFEVNIWGENDSNSLIINTLRKIKFKYQGNELDIGEIPINFNYKNVESAFRFLSQQANHLEYSILNCISRLKERKNTIRYGSYVDLMNYLHHIYRLNTKGINHHNYACSSDIARLVILYMEGGIYLDVDVELSDIDIKNTQKGKISPLDNLRLQSDIGIGDCSGSGWYSDTSYNEIGNAIIASIPQSKSIFKLLLDMATMMKIHHLGIQMYQSPKCDEFRKIKRSSKKHNKHYEFDKRVDLARKLKDTHQINMDMKCSIQDPVWRTSFSSHYSNDKIDREERRIRYTTKLTGPDFIDNFLNPKQKIDFPNKYKLMSKNKNDSVFKNVNDVGDWSVVKTRNNTSSDEDPFT